MACENPFWLQLVTRIEAKKEYFRTSSFFTRSYLLLQKRKTADGKKRLRKVNWKWTKSVSRVENKFFGFNPMINLNPKLVPLFGPPRRTTATAFSDIIVFFFLLEMRKFLDCGKARREGDYVRVRGLRGRYWMSATPHFGNWQQGRLTKIFI